MLADWSNTTDSNDEQIYCLKVNHDRIDEKGRVIGGVAVVRGHGIVWTVEIQATRDGQAYGAYHRGSEYQTLSLAQQAGLRGLLKQRQKYQKKYPGT